MRHLGRMTRKGVDTVKEKTGMPADEAGEAGEDDTASAKDSSKTREGGE
jgi:hypothetical protein